MFLSLKNGSMVLAAVCALSFTATAQAAVHTSTHTRQARELANLKASDPNDTRTMAGAVYKAAKKEDCKFASKSSRTDVAVVAKANAGGKSSGGPVRDDKAIQ